jgi:hypothetical protein
MVEINLDKKMKEISPKIPKDAQDITIGEMISLSWGKLSPRISKLTVKDLRDIRTAFGEAGKDRAMFTEADFAATSEVSWPCCCCCWGI